MTTTYGTPRAPRQPVGRLLLLGVLPVALAVLLPLAAVLAQPWLLQGDGWGLRVVEGVAGGVAVAVLLRRWAVWRWLTGLVAGTVPLAPLALATPQPALPGTLAVLLALLGLLTLGWRVPVAPAHRVAGGLLLGLAGLALWLGGRVSATLEDVRIFVVVVALVCLLPALAGSLGLGRSRGSALRPLVVVATLVALVPVALATLVDERWWASVVLLLPGVAPTAGALGLTAVLRGRRGRATLRPQSDAVDDAAVVDFDTRYATPALAPVVIVIAAYNEAGGHPGVLRELPESVSGLPTSIVVVDDGSSDGTADAVLADLTAYLVAPAANRGQGQRCGSATGWPASTAPGSWSAPTPTASTTPRTCPPCWPRCWTAAPTSSPARGGSAARRPGTGSAGWACTSSPGRCA